jgi:DNA-binding XRE family transcriptional regulator
VEYVLPGKALATGGGTVPGNNVQKFRESLMMSKAELARKAGLSTLTIDRIEAGRPCRLDTKRKILLALGMKVSDKDRVFGPGSDDPSPASRAAGGVPAVAGDPVRRS